jgi:hypothetical protein
MGEAKPRKQAKAMTVNPDAAALLDSWASGQYRLRRSPLSPEIVDQVKQLRCVLAKLRANPIQADRVVEPSIGQVIDILDGETDHLLHQMEPWPCYPSAKTRGEADHEPS